EATVDLRNIDPHGAAEYALLGDLHDAAVHRRLDASLHHEGVAVGDFDALQLDVGPHDELAALRVGAAGRTGNGLRFGRLGLRWPHGWRRGRRGIWIARHLHVLAQSVFLACKQSVAIEHVAPPGVI